MASEAEHQRFFIKNVHIPRKDMNKTAERVKECVKEILDMVNAWDNCFHKEPISSGSYSEFLKVDKPDEFDFMVPLFQIPKLVLNFDINLITRNEVTVTFRDTDAEFKKMLLMKLQFPNMFFYASKATNEATATVQQCTSWNSSLPQEFNPRHVMRIFQERVVTVLQEFAPCHAGICRLKPNSPAVTVTFHVNRQEVDVDLVPVILNPFKSWLLRWPRTKWPSREKVEEIQKCGIDLVAKEAWRFSFSQAEKILMTSIDADGGRRRDSLKYLKYVVQEKFPKKFGHILCSYHLKTTLFWACERNPYHAQWDGLKVSLELLITTLLGFLDEWKIPHYFLPRVNLLDENENLKHEFRHYAHRHLIL